MISIVGFIVTFHNVYPLPIMLSTITWFSFSLIVPICVSFPSPYMSNMRNTCHSVKWIIFFPFSYSDVFSFSFVSILHIFHTRSHDGNLCWFCSLVYLGMQISLRHADFDSFGYICSWIKWYGFLRKFRSDFHSGWIKSESLHRCKSVPLSSCILVSVCYFCCRFLDDNSSDWGELESQFSFDLHFPDGKGCWTFLYIRPSHLNFFWGLSV